MVGDPKNAVNKDKGMAYASEIVATFAREGIISH